MQCCSYDDIPALAQTPQTPGLLCPTSPQVEYKKKYEESKGKYHCAPDTMEQLHHRENVVLHSQVSCFSVPPTVVLVNLAIELVSLSSVPYSFYYL